MIDFQGEFGVNAGYVESLFEQWQNDPGKVQPEWRAWFEQLAADGSVPPIDDDHAPPETQSAAPVAEVADVVEVAPASPAAAPAPAPAPTRSSPPADEESEREVLRGVPLKIAENMIASLGVPTATSARTMAVKVLTENRRILNRHMSVRALGKASYTHVFAYALVRALSDKMQMQAFYEESDDRAFKVTPKHVNLGLAIDLETPKGRTLVVPNIKGAEKMSFKQFYDAYQDVVARARKSKLTAADFRGTTASLSNPGGIGTHLSVPRLMQGQGLIIATGSIGVPTETAHMASDTLADLAIGPIMTVTSTYDHRVIQGAESGFLLQRIDQLLQGEERFYDEIFHDMRLPWSPARSGHDGREGKRLSRGEKQAKVSQLINAYRNRGCRIADLDPLEYKPDMLVSLDPSWYGFTIWDLDREFICGGLQGQARMPLRDILTVLSNTYCRRWTIEYMHIANRIRKQWIRDRVETPPETDEFDLDARKRILALLYKAENFERFLHTRYVGNKRFSLEGADVLIPALSEVIEFAADQGVGMVVIGMAHRGRLNVLANILNKSYESIFSEFEGVLLPISSEGSGDVKYHLGQKGIYTTSKGIRVDVVLSANPSHLEAVDPVVCGMVRGYQDEQGDEERRRVLSVLVHGDAAFTGQGVVAETLQMSNLRANFCGGTVHIVVNNQIGFTASPRDTRSTYYCTDLAKGIEAPILHANGDYPESVLRAVRVAMDYHRHFCRDVVLDVVCYRRWGHNEGDEPAYTQPRLYRKINQHPTVIENYKTLLMRRKQLTPEQADEVGEKFNQELRDAQNHFRETHTDATSLPLEEIVDISDDDVADYAVAPLPPESFAVARLTRIIDRLNEIPEGHVVHPNLLRQLRRREDMVRGSQGIDWGCAEALAFATLLEDGVSIRINGQDSRRGTFSQRHAVIRDQDTEEDYIPLRHIGAEGTRFEVYDSVLSEEAALAFEFGYSVARPKSLTVWEAQFGDFVNGAQIPIDQFIASSEAKWRQLSGVTLLLPHGYDGQGPEHSSGRIERFLELCAHGNMSVTNCSTSAQYFHLLRRQGIADPKRPLVIFTPKSLLRDKRAASPTADLSEGTFQLVVSDPHPDPANVKRIVFCSGKVYYDLDDERTRANRDDVAILRIEQLYPFPRDRVIEEMKRYAGADVVWCQEEPKNMGPWPNMLQRFFDLGVAIEYAGRGGSSSPATGSYTRHKAEQAYVVRRALGAV